jgi:hypothetical protein
MLILYLAVLMTAAYWVVRMLGPEMAKPPKRRPVAVSDEHHGAQADDPGKRLEKLEMFLAEKNNNIQLLQTELRIFQVQVRNFDRIRSLLEDEIDRLREQNRIFRSELGLPAAQLKENSIT